jgi:hypothetical protein
MKNGVCLLQKKFVGVQPFIAENKTKQNKTESESKDAPTKTHTIRSNKNIVS